jgi:hypothetical protein
MLYLCALCDFARKFFIIIKNVVDPPGGQKRYIYYSNPDKPVPKRINHKNRKFGKYESFFFDCLAVFQASGGAEH